VAFLQIWWQRGIH